MKKIVTLGAIAAVAGGMMFAQPVFEPSVTLDGSATAKWGVDLDAGQTGFQNDTSGDFKVKLWGDGSRELEEGDGIWAELKVTGKELTWNGKKEKDERWDGGKWELNEAKLHLGPVYVGVKSGDTQVGEYKFDGAIRSADNDNAKWLSNVGPDKFSQGIVVGFANDSFDLGVDLRSYYDDSEDSPTNTKYTSSYAIAAEAKIKDSNTFLPGLAVDAGVGYNISDRFSSKKTADDKVDEVKEESARWAEVKANQQNFFGVDMSPIIKAAGLDVDTSAEAEALEAAKKAYEDAKKDLDDGKAANLNDLEAKAAAYKTAKDNLKAKSDLALTFDARNVHTLGYAFNAAYKLSINDKFYLKPAVGLTGTNTTGKVDLRAMGNEKKDAAFSSNSNNLVVGALFGWGDTADSDAGVYFLNDGDQTKKVTPGISVVAAIPLATTVKADDTKLTAKGAVQAIIVPSVYLGDLIPNLKLAAYSEMALLKYVDAADRFEHNDDWTDLKTFGSAKNKDRTFALAVAAGVAYDIKATDDVTITPKAGIRYANTAYNENEINKTSPLSNKPLFEAGYKKMGGFTEGYRNKDYSKEGTSNYLNIKAGLDAAGLIPNTTFFVEYSSANLLMDAESTDSKDHDDLSNKDFPHKYYNVKAGTLDVGVKISF